ncbi:radical SAM superfamily protein [Mycobacterium xenopi 3993]|nr:radical SAM superfamily protein [Mycobacterium xenopi 3993]
MTTAAPGLVEQFERGLAAPICLTWELTYACNLACVHCLSSSGKRDPRELSTRQCKDIIDELERMQVFYVNIGGGEPTVRQDFWDLLDYATAHHVGVKFSTNGVRITPEVAERLAASDYVDVQISLDGATAEVNDAIRGPDRMRWRCARWKTWRPQAFPTPRSPSWQPVTTSTNWTNSLCWQRVTVRHCELPVCGPQAAGGCLGRATPDARAADPALQLAGRQGRPGVDG